MALNEPPLSENSAGGVIETIAISKPLPSRNGTAGPTVTTKAKRGPKDPKEKPTSRKSLRTLHSSGPGPSNSEGAVTDSGGSRAFHICPRWDIAPVGITTTGARNWTLDPNGGIIGNRIGWGERRVTPRWHFAWQWANLRSCRASRHEAQRRTAARCFCSCFRLAEVIMKKNR